MKIAFSLVVKEDGTQEALVEQIRAAGFQGLEPTFGLEGTLPVKGDAQNSGEKLRRLAEKHGLKIPSMRGGPGFWPLFASEVAEHRTQAVELARQALEAVRVMGGDTLLIVPGQWQASQSYGLAWTSAVETAKRVGEVAAEMGIKVGLENVENRFLLSPRDWTAFLDEVGSQQVRMYFDAGNVVYLGLGWPEQWIRELGRKYITRIHFKDADTRGALRYMLEGQVNWPAVRRAMGAIGYDDWVGVELTLPQHHVGAMLAGAYRATAAILGG